MDRRSFAQLMPALLALAALPPAEASAQTASNSFASVGAQEGSRPGGGQLPTLVSGVYPPGPAHGAPPQRVSHRFLAGMLKAGNIQMEIHETRQEPGTPHEAVGKHLHSEIWLVREGLCELTTNGITRPMKAGDVGLCCAGDLHYIRNAGDTPCEYFVVTVGPPEHA